MHRLRGPLLALLAIALTGALPAAAAAAITGTVYMDYNSNGQRDLGGYEIGTQAKATDVPVAGVTVTAYDETGTQVGTTTSAADGTYTLTPSTGDRIRLEFSVPTGYQPSGVGSQNGTSVRFVSPNATNVDFAVTKPDTYCQDNPLLISCQAPYLAFGANMAGPFTMPSAFSDPLDVGTDGILPWLQGIKGGSQVTTADKIGAAFGVGVDRKGFAYYGTYVKRHAPYGMNGRGQWIYRVNVATGTTDAYFRIDTNQLPDHDARIASGTNADGQAWPAYAVDGLRADNNSSDVYHMVGRAGIGDVDVSADGSTIWAVEMTETAPKLWQVSTTESQSGPPASSSYPITAPTTYGSGASAVTCEGIWHPMGIGLSGDQLLVGGVCGAENHTPQMGMATHVSSTGGVATLEFANDAAISRIAVGDRIGFDTWKPSTGAWWTWGTWPNGSPIVGEMDRYVDVTAKTTVAGGGVASLSFAIPASWGDLARRSITQMSVLKTVPPNAFILSFDKTSGQFTTVFGFSTGYPKSATSGTRARPGQSLWSNMWQPWYDGNLKPLTMCAYRPSEWEDWCRGGRGTPVQWGKPMLANIEIRADGSLALGFRDRMADQSAANTVDYESSSVSSPAMQANPSTAVAETLQVCRIGNAYILESAGACGDVQGANLPKYLGDEPQAVRDTGPLYWSNGLHMNHPNASLGGLAQMPGVKVLWSTTYDVSGFDSQGIRAMGPCPADDPSCGPRPADDGALIGGSDLVTANQPTYCGTDASCWKKGNGLGDLEVVCNAAPVEIGNRVWSDWNNNGIQDAGEMPIAGVTVRLYNAGGTLVGTAVTDVNGTYYFSSLSTASASGDGTNVGGGLVPGAAFTVRLDKASDYAAGGPLEGMVLTTPNVETQGDAVDSDATTVSGYPRISIPARSAGENNHTFDVGFYDTRRVGMGNYTWIDTNKNGLQDAGEAVLPGVKVQLLYPDGSVALDASGNPVPEVTTDANGYYYVGNLLPGSYQARFTLPTGTPYFFTTPNVGSDAAVNSNPVRSLTNPRIGLTPVFAIRHRATGDTRAFQSGETDADFVNPTIDAGVTTLPKVGMGNYTWIDTDKDGVQDAGEAVLPGVSVQLLNEDGTPAYDRDGNPVGPVVTDANGRYYIGNLLPGTYKAQFTLPRGYVFTTPNAGSDAAVNSNPVPTADASVGLTPSFTITDGAGGETTAVTDPTATPNADFVNLTIDAGVVPLPKVGMGNYVWIDADKDGLQDNAEQPLEGVKVELLNKDGSPALDYDGNPVPPVFTDANGRYYIGNLLPGTYKAQFTLPDSPSGAVFTKPNAGSNTAENSNPAPTANPKIGVTPAFTIGSSAGGETTTVTDPAATPDAAFVNLTIDAGVVFPPRAGMGNYTWIDADKDGLKGQNELPLPGVRVQLLNPDGSPALDIFGNPVDPVVTDANGYYYIGNLAPGGYIAEFALPRGYVFTTPNEGSDPAVNSNPEETEDPTVGRTPAFAIASAVRDETRAALQSEPNADFVNPTIDAGVVVAPRVGMGNYTWIDANKDGLQGADETPLAGVRVQLLEPDGSIALDYDGNPVAPVVTDADGRYFIGNLAPGRYRAQFTLPSGYTFTTPGVGPSGDDSNPEVGTDPLVGVTPVFTIGASATGDTTAVTAPDAEFANLTIDAGVVPVPVSRASTEPRVAVGNYVWFDRNDNGKQDRREKPMPGVEVRLFTKDGRPAVDASGNPVPVKTTDAKGYYVFDGLAPGEYYVEFETPRRYTFTVDGRGTSANGSNPKVSRNPRIARTPVFQVHGGVRGNTVANTNPSVNASFIDPTIDAGVVPQCTKYTFDKTLIYMGERVRVTVTAKLNGVLQRNKTVTLKGLGVHLTGTTNAKGQVSFWVEPEQGGLLVASSPDAMPGCTPQAVTVSTSMFPVTG